MKTRIINFILNITHFLLSVVNKHTALKLSLYADVVIADFESKIQTLREQVATLNWRLEQKNELDSLFLAQKQFIYQSGIHYGRTGKDVVLPNIAVGTFAEALAVFKQYKTDLHKKQVIKFMRVPNLKKMKTTKKAVEALPIENFLELIETYNKKFVLKVKPSKSFDQQMDQAAKELEAQRKVFEETQQALLNSMTDSVDE